MGVNMPLASAPSGLGLGRGMPLASPSIKLIVGAVAPTVRRNSRRENPGAEVFDFLGCIGVTLRQLRWGEFTARCEHCQMCRVKRVQRRSPDLVAVFGP